MMKSIAVTAALLSLAGCASVFDPNGASADFSCEDPNDAGSVVDGVTCKTPFAIYKSTHGAPEVRQSDLPIGVTMEDYNSGNYGGNVSNPNEGMPHPATGMTYHLSGGMVAQGQPEFARPVRTPAQVMRIWIAPWIDKSDDLHFPSYVYTEIQPRRWNFGVEAFNGRGLVIPTKELGAVPGAPVSSKRANGLPAQRQVTGSSEQSHLETGAELPDLPN